MEKIEQYSTVMIKPGTYPALFGNEKTLVLKQETQGAVVEIYGDQELFTVDIGSSPADWQTIDAHRSDIVGVVHR